MRCPEAPGSALASVTFETLPTALVPALGSEMWETDRGFRKACRGPTRSLWASCVLYFC